jgi:hypothetical protein
MTITRTNWQRAEEALELAKQMEAMTGVDDLRSQVSDALCHFMHLCRLMRDEEGDEIDFNDCLSSARINFDAEADEDPDDAPLDPAQRHEAEQERITAEYMERLGEHLGVASVSVSGGEKWEQIKRNAAMTNPFPTGLKPDAAWEAKNLEKARALMLEVAKGVIAMAEVDQSAAMSREYADLQDRRDTATILAALRHFQRDLIREGDWIAHDILDIATESGTLEPLTAEEIDALCESRINL